MAGAFAMCLPLLGAARPQPEEVLADPEVLDLERRFREDVAPIMGEFCFRCHGSTKQKAELDFESVSTLQAVLDGASDWEFVREMVTTGQMPPDDEPQPTEHQTLTISQWIDDALAYYPEDGAVDPGWFTIHRLNRSEYRNTMRDLLGIDPDVIDLASDLPRDDTGYGFDNIADVLSMSPLQLELYLAAAERALDLALGPPVEISSRPVALRGLTSTGNGRALGRGGHMLYSRGSVVGGLEIPATGEYEITIVAWGTPGGDEHPHMDVRTDAVVIGEVSVGAGSDEPGEYTLRAVLPAGRQRILASFTNDYYVPNVADRNLAIESISIAGPLSAASVERPEAFDEVFFVMPGEQAGEAGERSVAHRIIERFAGRAFRRPVRADELRSLNKVYEASRRAGDSFEEAVRVSLTATLVSPSFLYRSVQNFKGDQADHVYSLNGHELASRLSYFLWSSMPDEELSRLARRGELESEEVLLQQARRMLADPKADAFIENFAGQWLLLRNLGEVEVDREAFPAFDDELRRSMATEATLFFEDVVRNDRSVLDLLDSPDTFLNEKLAGLYGLPGVTGEGFRRVTLPENSPRGGVLTMGAVLTVTSNPNRTSPVKRGLYVLDQLLGTPPPPPPPDVAPLEESAKALGAAASLREQLAAHLTNPTCASCHRRMDPIGLAMENFDAIGAWRDTEAGRAIDASGVLPGGVGFEGPVELKEILLARQDLFVENLSRKVLTYALGRGLEPFDRPTVRRITDHARAGDYRFSSLVEGVVLSEAFRSCRGRD